MSSVDLEQFEALKERVERLEQQSAGLWQRARIKLFGRDRLDVLLTEFREHAKQMGGFATQTMEAFTKLRQRLDKIQPPTD